MKRREALKTLLAAMALPSVLASRSGTTAVHRGASGRSRPPNIILILADDLGYGQLGCNGNLYNETPNLDRIANEGMRFSNAYAAAAVCSPTRAALMTGQHPARQGITDYLARDDDHFLSPSYITINERLESAGYVTGLIGKWHFTGDYGKNLGAPQRHGWHEVLLSETRYIASGAYFAPYSFMPRVQPREPGEYLTERLNTEAVEFIRRHRDEPFFLYLSHYAVHKEMAARDEIIAKYANKFGAGLNGNDPVLAAMLESVDDGVGQILQTLEALGIDDDTLVVFTSDNGGETANTPLRTGKSTLYEGGIRVPLVMRYPDGIRAAVASDIPAVTHDLYPTFMELARVRPRDRQPVDGFSLAPIFRGRGELGRNTLYWHYPRVKPHSLGGRSSGAIRAGDYKLIEFFDTGELELYDLRADVGEANNLASSMPGKVAEMREMLGAWRTSTDASRCAPWR
ncbi:MAG: sulfatase [Gammaproteobacteria bacterium]